MAGIYPMLDTADLETRVRTYLNEVTADFYTQANIYNWVSVAAKDIAQKALCVRRILNAVTVASTRTVATSVYKVLQVEYIPSSGRSIMLTKIDPLRVGHYPTNGTAPQYWYEFGSTIGIDPLPDAAYNLRLYVADIPKIQNTTYPITGFNTGWGSTNGTGSGTWGNGATSNIYQGTNALAGTSTYGTGISADTNYTFSLHMSTVTRCGLAIKAGTTTSPTLNTDGYHAVTLTSGGGTALSLVATPTSGTSGTLTIDDIYILKEGDIGTAADQTELPPMWQHLLALYATFCGLIKNKKNEPARMLESIYRNEINFLRQNVIEIVPDGADSFNYGE